MPDRDSPDGRPAVCAAGGELEGTGGVRLHFRGWRAEGSRGRVLLVHGLGDHSGRFERFGRRLASEGLEVFALDLRGHGRSGGPRGHADAFDRLLDDVGRLLVHAAEARGQRPTVLVGHSLGGLVVLRCLQEGSAPALRGAVAVAPFLGLEMEPPGWKLALGRLADRWLPRLRLASGADTELVLRDPAARAERRSDPRVHDRISARLWGEMQRAAEAVLEGAAGFDAPVLLQVAGDDRVVSSPAVIELADRLGPLAEIRRYPDAYHDLLHDPVADEAAADALAWIRERVRADGTEGRSPAYRLHREGRSRGPRSGRSRPRRHPDDPGGEPMDEREPVADEEEAVEGVEDRADDPGSVPPEERDDDGEGDEGGGLFGLFADDELPDEVRAELEELRDVRERHLRLAAEYENYRKRTRREMSEARQRAQAELTGRLLEALDDLDRFVDSTDGEIEVESLREGVEMVRRKLWKELSEAGLERMEAEGERFDPEVHDALMTTPVEEPEEDGRVSRVLIAGYRFGDRVLRPARVEVQRYAGDEQD